MNYSKIGLVLFATISLSACNSIESAPIDCPDNPLMTGDNCDKCINGKFGEKCDQNCENPLFTGTSCNRCVKSGFSFESNCLECTNSKMSVESDCKECINDYGSSCQNLFGTVSDPSGKEYKTVVIDGLRWMAENYSYKKGTSMNLSTEAAPNSGLAYDWSTAKTVCPSGWRLPTKDEANALITKTIKTLRATTWEGGTNTTGFSAKPAGAITGNTWDGVYGKATNVRHSDEGKKAIFWVDSGSYSSGSNLVIQANSAQIMTLVNYVALPVRCVTDN